MSKTSERYPTFEELVEESKHLPEFTLQDAREMAPQFVIMMKELLSDPEVAEEFKRWKKNKRKREWYRNKKKHI